MMKRLLVITALSIALTAPAANAQRGAHRGSTAIELGIDGGIAFGLDNPKVTVVSIPIQDFRIGFIVRDNVEFEPRFTLKSVHSAGFTATDYSLELGVLLMPGGDRVGKGLYLRPFLGFTGSSATGFGSDNNGFAGAGVGVKLPFADRRLATRLEALYSHGFGNGSSNAIGLLFGLSFFTR